MKTLIFSSVIMLANIFCEHPTKKSMQWQFDKSNSTLGFSINRVVLSPVKGKVTQFDVNLINESNDFEDAKIIMTADVNSITTGNRKRDRELKGKNFFEMEKFPTIKFVSSNIKKITDNNYKASGNLTMHGITKSVDLNVIYTPKENNRVSVFSIECTLNRMDFNIGKGTDSKLVSEHVTVTGQTVFKLSADLQR